MMDSLENSAPADTLSEAIAVIGMAGRFPGAGDVETFWRNVVDGRESITRFSDAELAAAGVPPQVLSQANYVPARGVLDDADCFDHDFFGISPREAALMDPQHRLLLETGHAALESAGYSKGSVDGWTGVFAGAARSGYWHANLIGHPDIAEGDDQSFIGNEKDFLATRLAFKLDLHGPALDVQTGCSTSLVAVHLACRSLLAFECDMALAGGVTVALPLAAGYPHQPGSVLALDGHCRPFDAAGDGIVPGNAVAIVVLKRLSEALADGDLIHAVIRGSAINNDGARKMSFTAPSVEGQSQAVLLAQQLAGIGGDAVELVEAHGTGTLLGDPIEVSALTQAFRETTERRQFCALGSVKGNVGHLDAAAGVAGLIKAVCAVRDGILPPTINVNLPNPAIDFAASPFYLPQSAAPWSSAVRRAGVSAFGIGGTNAHIVVESPPARPVAADDGTQRILALSAGSEAALDRLSQAVAARLVGGSISLRDAAQTLQAPRQQLAFRRAVIARTSEEAAAALDGSAPARRRDGPRPVSRPLLALLFPGGGIDYKGIAQPLMQTEAAFAAAIDEICRGFEAEGILLQPALMAKSGEPSGGGFEPASLSLPAIFAVSYGLARLWEARGLRPDLLVGHSLGEYAAATVAGVFAPGDAARLVAARSRLQEEYAGGAMLSVMAGADAVMMLADGSVELAAVNGPSLCTVSGSIDAIDRLQAALSAESLRHRRLSVPIGGHSRAIAAGAAQFRTAFAGIALQRPAIPVLSSLTGRYEDKRLTEPDYWVEQLHRTVRFDRALDTLLAEPDLVLLDCGPGDVLTGLAAQHPASRPDHIRISTTGSSALAADRDGGGILAAAADLWVCGVAVDLAARVGVSEGRHALLPTYPFERTRHWIDPPTGDRNRRKSSDERPLAQWFHLPAWHRTAPLAEAAAGTGPAFVFDNGSPLSEAVVAQLRTGGWDPVVRIRAGDGFSAETETEFAIQPAVRDDLALVLAASGVSPGLVVHLWSHGEEAEEVKRGFSTVVALLQAIAAEGLAVPACILAGISRGEKVGPDDALIPARATLHGVLQVIPQELPGTRAMLVDLSEMLAPPSAAAALLAEIGAGDRATVVALRGPMRFVRHFEPFTLPPEAPVLRRLDPGDAVVITGGVGRIGLLLARHCTRTLGLRVALVTRPDFPDEFSWGDDAQFDAKTRLRIQAVQDLRAGGHSISVYPAGLEDPDILAATLRQIETELGPVRGIVHAAAVTHGKALLSPVLQLAEGDAAAQFGPKLGGVAVLAEAIAACAAPPRFVLLMSSNASILGGIGFAAYSAANHALDRFAARQGTAGGTAWISANWDRWLLSDDELQAGAGSSMDAFAMRPDESLAAFDRIVRSAGVEQVVVTRGDLVARQRIWLQAGAAAPVETIARPRSVRTPYRAPQSETERAICGIWSELLGIEEIGVDDSFFELGGHSLRAIQLLARIAEMFSIRLTLKMFFAEPTAAGLAEAVIAQLGDRIEGLATQDLLHGLEALGGDVAATVVARS